jgi:hypothetical protein
MDKMWQFYDFDANWGSFLEVWKSAAIQSALKPHMDSWCRSHAYDTDARGNRPAWREGDPLWHLSRTDFWDINIRDSVDSHIDKNRMVEHMSRTMKNVMARPNITKDRCVDTLYAVLQSSGEYDLLYERYSPKPDTIESLILVLGKNHLSHALFHVANMLFPDDDLVLTTDEEQIDIILVPDKHVVFDLLDFFYAKYELVEDLLRPDADYDAMVEQFRFLENAYHPDARDMDEFD